MIFWVFVALLAPVLLPHAQSLTCKYVTDNFCSGSLMAYDCDPPASTCCYHLAFSDSSCTQRKPHGGNLERQDNYILGSCRAETNLVQDMSTEKCQGHAGVGKPYYMMLTKSGDNLTYCAESFADAVCTKSTGEMSCFTKDAGLLRANNYEPLETCMPEANHFEAVTCGPCYSGLPPTPKSIALPPPTTASGVACLQPTLVMLMFSIVQMLVSFEQSRAQ